MSFTTFSGVTSLFFAAAPPPPSFVAAFGALSTLGQVPITIRMGKSATYSVLNNGVEIATSQTATTYTIIGLDNNVQIGPITLVPYDSQGVAGNPTTVIGGSGGGKIYTWAQANTPTFNPITSTGTTLTCTGAFSKVYVTFSGGSASPASGTLITGTNSINQVYSGMTASTTYIFVVYPVNGDGIPASVTGTNSATGSVNTSAPPSPTVWVVAGYSNVTGGNSLAYSVNGTKWTGLGITHASAVYFVKYSSIQKCWVAGASGYIDGNSILYSANGVNWTGLGKTVISSSANGSAYSISQDCWVVAGTGGTGGNTLAYSANGINWTGLDTTIFSYGLSGKDVAYSEYQKCWVAIGAATGAATGNSVAYSANGITWTGLGKSIFNPSTSTPTSISYSEYYRCWVVSGKGSGNVLGYSSNGINWTGLGQSFPDGFANVYNLAYNNINNFWIASSTNNGGNQIIHSSNGINWTSTVRIPTVTSAFGTYYSVVQQCWMIVGKNNSNKVLSYSVDGFVWTGLGNFDSAFPDTINSAYPISIYSNQ
jgi:hypothetical protein